MVRERLLYGFRLQRRRHGSADRLRKRHRELARQDGIRRHERQPDFRLRPRPAVRSAAWRGTTAFFADDEPLFYRRAARRRLGVALSLRFREVSRRDRKSTRLNSSHMSISYAVFCLKKKKKTKKTHIKY